MTEVLNPRSLTDTSPRTSESSRGFEESPYEVECDTLLDALIPDSADLPIDSMAARDEIFRRMYARDNAFMMLETSRLCTVRDLGDPETYRVAEAQWLQTSVNLRLRQSKIYDAIMRRYPL